MIDCEHFSALAISPWLPAKTTFRTQLNRPDGGPLGSGILAVGLNFNPLLLDQRLLFQHNMVNLCSQEIKLKEVLFLEIERMNQHIPPTMSPPEPATDWMTQTELAELLGVSTRTISARSKAGNLQCYEHGVPGCGQRRFSRTLVDRMLHHHWSRAVSRQDGEL